MLYREIITVCSEIHTKHINTLCGQNVDLFKSLKRGGKYSNHWALKRHCLIVLYSNKYFWQLPSRNIPYKVASGPLVQIQLRGGPICGAAFGNIHTAKNNNSEMIQQTNKFRARTHSHSQTNTTKKKINRNKLYNDC